MNIPYSFPKNTNHSNVWLFVAGFMIVMLALILSMPALQLAALQPGSRAAASSYSTAPLAPHVMPVPTPPQNQPEFSTQLRSTPAPAQARPAPQPVATPRSTSRLP